MKDKDSKSGGGRPAVQRARCGSRWRRVRLVMWAACAVVVFSGCGGKHEGREDAAGAAHSIEVGSGTPAALTSSPLAFRFEQIGPAPFFRPTITNVQVIDFDGDGHLDVIACDAQSDSVILYRRVPSGGWEEQVLGQDLIAPAHATVVDLDQDGDQDVVVSVMGNLLPDDGVIGSLVLLENRGESFTQELLIDDLRRVVDSQPGDFDGDGDLDLAVAVFGYLRGQVLWLENRGGGAFLDHELLSAAGTIHVPVADYDGDGDLDIAAVVSQEDEEVWGFENRGNGDFTPRRLWTTVNFDMGSAGLVKTDLDGDGDIDLLLPVGDNLEDSFSVPQPYHGCLWLENKGGWEFLARRIATFPGTYAAAAADLDADGDEDVVLCSMVNHWDEPDAPSLVWLENNGEEDFTQHAIAVDPIMLITVDCGDVNGDGQTDVVAGGLHLYPPFDRLGRISSWIGGPPDESDTQAGSTIDFVRMVAPGPPLPNLDLVDAISRSDISSLYNGLRKKVDSGADDVEDWIALGRVYYAFGFFPDAVECFEKALVRNPSSAAATFMLGSGLQRLGKVMEAVTRFTRALELSPEAQKPSIWHEIGRCYLRLEEERNAEASFVNAGEFSASLNQLAKLRLKLGRAPEALPILQRLQAQQPQAIEVYLLLARAAAALGQHDHSRRFSDLAEYNSTTLPMEPLLSGAEAVRTAHGANRLESHAKKLMQEDQWDEAARVLESLMNETRESNVAILLAATELKRDRPERAIEVLEQLDEERGAIARATVLLGDAYRADGQHDRATSTWTGTAQDVLEPEIHKRLAEYDEEFGNEDAARRHVALKLEADGIRDLRIGNMQLAATGLESAVDLEPALPRAWFYLGECRRILNRPSEARDAYENALRYNPNHGRARAMLNRVSGTQDAASLSPDPASEREQSPDSSPKL